MPEEWHKKQRGYQNNKVLTAQQKLTKATQQNELPGVDLKHFSVPHLQ